MSESRADGRVDERPNFWRRFCEALPACSIELPAPKEAPAVVRLDWRMVVAGCWTVFWLFVFNLLDPLGVFSNADRYSGDLFHRAMAALNFDADPAVDVAVILWTDLDLIEMERSWPVPYGDHAEALKYIRQAEPKAVFVDIAFIDDRLATDFTAPDLIREILAYEGQGDHQGVGPIELPKLFIADPAPFDRDTAGYEWALDSQFEAVPVAVPGAAFQRFGQQYPYIGADITGMAAFRGRSGVPGGVSVSRATAACALFAALHLEQLAGGASAGLSWCGDRSARLAAEGSEGLMGVQWITQPRPNLRSRNLTRDCRHDIPDDLGAATLDLFQSRQTCGPFPTYTLVDLLVASPSQRQQALYGKVVFYGADILAVSDRVEPPTHDPLPGVFLHAMAYENLVRHEGHPLRTDLPINLGLFRIGTDDLLFLVGLSLIVPLWKFSVAIETAYRLAAVGQPDDIVRRIYSRVWRLELAFLFAAVTVVIALILIGYPLLNLTPVNFVGLLGLVFLWELLNLGAFIPPNGTALGRWRLKQDWFARKLCAPNVPRSSQIKEDWKETQR